MLSPLTFADISGQTSWVGVHRLTFVCKVLEMSPRPGGRGGYCIISLGSCLCGGSWICLLVWQTLRRVEECDREMERDGGWTGRVRADRHSVMNINGLSSSGFTFQAWENDVESTSPNPHRAHFYFPTHLLHCTKQTLLYCFVFFSLLCCLHCGFTKFPFQSKQLIRRQQWIFITAMSE